MVDWTGRMSLSVLPSIRRKKGNTQSTIAPCTVVIGNGQQRHRHGVHLWPDGAHEEGQWEYDTVPRKGAVRGVYASL